MKNDTHSLEKTTIPVNSKPVRPPIWTRIWEAYQYKKRTDQTFFATVVAFQVLLVVMFLLAGTAIVISKSNLGGVGTSLFKR